MAQLRQPRIAEIVAGRLRDDILTGKLREGDSLPRQEDLLEKFRVSPPAVREAMRILETEGLITVRRGNVGGAVVHLPTAERTARMISMVLQSRGATPGDVSGALAQIEPVCARLCALRPDRQAEVVPQLEAAVEQQHAEFDDIARYNANARAFHETLVSRCGSETMILVTGALETIWSAHETSVWNEQAVSTGGDVPGPGSALAQETRWAALRDHEKLLGEIRAGDADEAFRLASTHLAATRRSTLASGDPASGNPSAGDQATINTNLIGDHFSLSYKR